MLMLRVLLPLLLVACVSAHSWIECLDTDRDVVFNHASAYIYGGQGAAGKCRGYQRNYRGRGEGIHDEELMVKILKDEYTKPNTSVCKTGAITDDQGFHKHVIVAPGEKVFFGYMPNGHVAVDKAARGTLWGLYWSKQPRVDLKYTSDLTPERLLGRRRHDFDDGVCGQTYSNRTTKEKSGRAGDAFPCVGKFAIPPGTAPGVYQVVWMWKFWDEKNDKKEITTVGGQYGGAAYSSCFDVEVLPTTGRGEGGRGREKREAEPSYGYEPGSVVPGAPEEPDATMKTVAWL